MSKKLDDETAALQQLDDVSLAGATDLLSICHRVFLPSSRLGPGLRTTCLAVADRSASRPNASVAVARGAPRSSAGGRHLLPAGGPQATHTG